MKLHFYNQPVIIFGESLPDNDCTGVHVKWRLERIPQQTAQTEVS